MGSIQDIGTPGQPLDTPPLTAWQAAVRDVLGGSDIPVDTRFSATLGTLTPAAGWAEFGAAYAGLIWTKQGRIAVVGGMFKPTADKPVTAGTTYPLFTGGPPPFKQSIHPCLYITTGGIPLIGRATIDGTGGCGFTPSTSVTIPAAAGWVSIEVSYRTAT